MDADHLNVGEYKGRTINEAHKQVFVFSASFIVQEYNG